MIINDSHALLVILTISAVTVFLRLIPFFVLEQLSRNNYLRSLSEMMPTGVMILLVAYTLKDQNINQFPYAIPHIAATFISILLYWKTNNSLLSIGLGLSSYMIVINFIL